MEPDASSDLPQKTSCTPAAQWKVTYILQSGALKLPSPCFLLSHRAHAATVWHPGTKHILSPSFYLSPDHVYTLYPFGSCALSPGSLMLC